MNTFITLSDDSYQLTVDPAVSLVDEAGNPAGLELSNALSAGPLNAASPLVFTFEIDTAGPPAPSAPQLAAGSDSGIGGDGVTNSQSPIMSVTADPDLAVEIIANGRSAGFANEVLPGQYQLFVDASFVREGENLVLARSFDSLGNSSDLSGLLSFVFDSQPPEIADLVVDPLWLNDGPTQVSVVFNETDIDPASIGNLAQYRVLASGGDGTFNDGNEISISPTAVSFEPNSHTIDLNLPVTATGASQLTPETYQLTIVGGSGITDITGNAMTQSLSTEFSVVPAEIIHGGEHYRFVTDTGNVVTVWLFGEGDAEILLGKDIGSDNLIERIVVSNSIKRTWLKISSTHPGENVTIGQILADSPLTQLSHLRV